MKNKTVTENKKRRTEIIIDNGKMVAEPSLIKSCEVSSNSEFSKVANYLVSCPTQAVEIKLYDEYSESPSIFFHFVFLYNDFEVEIK